MQSFRIVEIDLIKAYDMPLHDLLIGKLRQRNIPQEAIHYKSGPSFSVSRDWRKICSTAPSLNLLRLSR